MLTKEENERLTHIGPGTPMGDVFRRYWHPVAARSDLDEEPTRQITVLGETMVLFRDRKGRFGCVGPQCAHRRAGMVFGIPEDDGLRCAYHGWKFDHLGRCIEQPAEDMEAPESTFRERTPIQGYPVQELGGLIFIYMGPEPRPLLPRWEPFVVDNVVRSIGWGIIPCNWMQCMENSLDQTHVEYLHRKFDNYVLERLGRTDLKHDVRHHARIGYDAFEYGIIKRRVWEGGTENDPEWRLGHPILFPNILANSSQTLQYRVPIDNEHTLHWWYNARPPKDGASVQQDGIPLYEVPIPGLDARGRPTWSTLDNNSGQDMLMWYTQGPIADRSNEKLGTADKGIILYRQLLARSMDEVQRGDDPLGVIRDPSQNVNIHIVSEDDGGGIAERRSRGVGDRRPAGSSAKYDPTLAGISDKQLAGTGS